MQDLLDKEIIDDYQEHFFHDTYTETCSECFKENRLMKAHKTVNRGSTMGSWQDNGRLDNYLLGRD